MLLIGCSAAAIAAACGDRAGAPPYAHTLPSKEAAARAVADALHARDSERLAALAISELEFRKHVWPRLPASRPEVGMPVDYVWADTSAKSRGYLGQLLAQHGGRRFTVDAVRVRGESTDYGAFRIHAKTALDVRDETGQAREVRLFGSLIETPAGWKVFSYIVD